MRIFGQYQAYQSSKLRDTDRGLREEISRRITMIMTHLNTLEARMLNASDAAGLLVSKRIREDLVSFMQDTQFTPTGSTDGNSMAAPLKKKQVKTLMEHDLEVLKRLVESTHLMNAIVEASSVQEQPSQSLEELEQKLVGCRNRFNDRTSFLNKL